MRRWRIKVFVVTCAYVVLLIWMVGILLLLCLGGCIVKGDFELVLYKAGDRVSRETPETVLLETGNAEGQKDDHRGGGSGTADNNPQPGLD